MKKFAALFILILALGVAACGNDESTEVASTKQEPVATATPTPTVDPEAEAMTETLGILTEMQRRNDKLLKLADKGVKAANNYNVDRICSISFEMEILMDEQDEDMEMLEATTPESMKEDAQELSDAFVDMKVWLRSVTSAASDLGC